MKYWSIFLILFLSHLIMAQTEHSALLDGTIAYEKGDFETATKKFEKALERNSSSLKGNFNLGNSLYKRQKYDEAATYYQNAIEAAEGNKEKAQAFYNFGNTRLAQAKRSMQQQGQGPAMLDEKGQKHLKEAIDSYKNALRNNAQDYDAKNNLATAYKLLRQQQQQQQQQQQNKEQNQDQQDQKNQDQKDQKNQQDKQENQQDKPSEKPKENQPIDNENQKNPADLEPQEMSKDEVDRLLEIIEQDDKKVQEKLMKRKRSKTKKPEKAW
ncbi:tetratricopeptide repeat protein [Aureispira sp. CCB-QB1]|uniref:tetratricopeptide repeat protein n=1 Tax=Aureispira sp. CCB-QB1 TaxID=1313421 RepID=UPI000696BECC|nr:tetratricopeptide repeat protein [Aureispira sp. CCB-QB1]